MKAIKTLELILALNEEEAKLLREISFFTTTIPQALELKTSIPKTRLINFLDKLNSILASQGINRE